MERLRIRFMRSLFLRYMLHLILFRYADIMVEKGVRSMIIEDLLAIRDMTKYRLAVEAGIPHATLSDICSGKTKLEKCSAETVYKLSKALGVSMETLTEDSIRERK